MSEGLSILKRSLLTILGAVVAVVVIFTLPGLILGPEANITAENPPHWFGVGWTISIALYTLGTVEVVQTHFDREKENRRIQLRFARRGQRPTERRTTLDMAFVQGFLAPLCLIILRRD